MSRRNGRVRWGLLVLLFVLVPVVEIYVLIQVGQVIGAWWTVLLLVADGVLGGYLMRRQGGKAWQALREALAEHRMPARELADGALVLIGGTLLLTPGFVTDVVGLFCVLPFTRPVARRLLTGFIARKFLGSTTTPSSGSAAGSTGEGGERTRQRPGPGSVVQGEVVD